MKQIILFIILIFFGLSQSLIAQKKVTGKVFDESNNNALAGASIKVIGDGIVASNISGNFSVNCGSRIIVTFIGYKPVEKTIKNCDEDFTIGLTPLQEKLNEVEITATSSQSKSLLSQPASITKLSELEIKRGIGLYLDDAINANIPGVSMNRRAVSSGQQFNIRGYGNGVRGTNGANSNFDGQGYKVYLNGIPVTDAEGITIMDDIDFGSVGNVEVTKGPAGTLYGLAIAGVVNLKTVRPEKGITSVKQDVLLGSYGLSRYTTTLQTAGDRSALLVNYGHQKSDGYLLHNASHKKFVNVAADFQPNAKQSISTYFGYSNSYDERAGELTLDQYRLLDYSGNPNYIKNNAHSEIVGFRAGLSHTYNFCSNFSNTTTVFGSSLINNASSAGGWTDKDPVNYGARTSLDTKFALGEGISLSGVTGAETQQQRAQIIGYAMVPDSNNLAGYNRIGAMRSNQFTISSTTSLFSQWTLNLPKDISITAGLGYSNMRIKLNDRFYVATANRAPTTYDTTYKNMFSPHVAINKIFSKQFSLYASYSRGFKAPVSSYFFIPTTGQVNKNLKPEIGDQFEVGSKGALMQSKLIYELAFFNAIFSDKMYAVAVPLNGSTTTTAYTYIANGGKQNHKGIEALVKYSLLESSKGVISAIRPFANVTYSDFKYEDYTFQRIRPNSGNKAVDTFYYNGQNVAGVSRYVANVGVDFSLRFGVYGNINYMYKDGMPITSDNTIKTTSFNLFNAKIGYKKSFGKCIDLDAYFGASNITNTQYPIMVFINQLPDAYVPAALNATFFGGISLKYIL